MTSCPTPTAGCPWQPDNFKMMAMITLNAPSVSMTLPEGQALVAAVIAAGFNPAIAGVGKQLPNRRALGPAVLHQQPAVRQQKLTAYASQTLRGALKAVPQGQWESGQALGLSKSAIFFRLVMPQMWRHALPGLGNQWLVLLKDTALVSLISVNDLMLQTKSIATRTQEPFTWYIVAAAIYLAITLISQYVLKRIDLRATRFERRPG